MRGQPCPLSAKLTSCGGFCGSCTWRACPRGRFASCRKGACGDREAPSERAAQVLAALHEGPGCLAATPQGGPRPPLCSREVGPGLAVASLCARPYSVHVESRPWVGNFRAGRWCGPDAPRHCGWPAPSCWEDTLELWFCPPPPHCLIAHPHLLGLEAGPLQGLRATNRLQGSRAFPSPESDSPYPP